VILKLSEVGSVLAFDELR